MQISSRFTLVIHRCWVALYLATGALTMQFTVRQGCSFGQFTIFRMFCVIIYYVILFSFFLYQGS